MLIIPMMIHEQITWKSLQSMISQRKHRMNALVGYSYQYYKYERNYSSNYDFPNDFSCGIIWHLVLT